MLRLTWIEDEQRGRVLRVEGRIVDEWSDLLETEAARVLSEGEAGELDLTGTTYVDRRGAEVLRRLTEAGFRVVGENPLIAEVRESGGLR